MIEQLQHNVDNNVNYKTLKDKIANYFNFSGELMRDVMDQCQMRVCKRTQKAHKSVGMHRRGNSENLLMFSAQIHISHVAWKGEMFVDGKLIQNSDCDVAEHDKMNVDAF